MRNSDYPMNRKTRNRYVLHHVKGGEWKVIIADGAGCGPLVDAPLAGRPKSASELKTATRDALAREGWELVETTQSDSKRGIASPGPDATPAYYAGKTTRKTGPRQALRRLRGKPVETEETVWKVFYDGC